VRSSTARKRILGSVWEKTSPPAAPLLAKERFIYTPVPLLGKERLGEVLYSPEKDSGLRFLGKNLTACGTSPW